MLLSLDWNVGVPSFSLPPHLQVFSRCGCGAGKSPRIGPSAGPWWSAALWFPGLSRRCSSCLPFPQGRSSSGSPPASWSSSQPSHLEPLRLGDFENSLRRLSFSEHAISFVLSQPCLGALRLSQCSWFKILVFLDTFGVDHSLVSMNSALLPKIVKGGVGLLRLVGALFSFPSFEDFGSYSFMRGLYYFVPLLGVLLQSLDS